MKCRRCKKEYPTKEIYNGWWGGSYHVISGLNGTAHHLCLTPSAQKKRDEKLQREKSVSGDWDHSSVF